MADLIAALAVCVQYAVVISLVYRYLWRIPISFVAIMLILLLVSGLIVWHSRKFSGNARRWCKLSAYSIVLGIAFFAWDWLLAYMHGHVNPLRFAGGLLGLPLTVAVCPGATIIAFAGALRATYLSHERP